MRTILSLILCVLTSSGCAVVSGKQESAPSATPAVGVPVDTVVIVDTVTTDDPEAAQHEQRAARLQLQLLEREALIDELRKALDAERQEVVRNMAKLQSQANRAEAASGMAEAEIALQALAAETGDKPSGEHVRGTELLRQAAVEFAKENYGGAIYLATEARTVAAAGQERMRGVGTGKLAAGESLFALPVPLVTVSRSNVRAGPGLGFGVETTLEPATPVTGLSYTSEWVRVTFGSAGEGWIYHTLVANEDTKPND